MVATLGWLLLGNLVSAVAWQRRVPINGGPLYAVLAAVLYANAWRDRARLRAAAPDLDAGMVARRLGAAAVVGLALSGPGVAAFRLPFVQQRLDYAPIERMSRGALARRLFFEIPLMTALSEELLFRGSLFPQWKASLAATLARNAAVFTAWHLIVTLRTVAETGFGRRPLGFAGAYAGSLLSVYAGGVALGAVRVRTGSILCAAVTHWIADAALTLGAWLP